MRPRSSSAWLAAASFVASFACLSGLALAQKTAPSGNQALEAVPRSTESSKSSSYASKLDPALAALRTEDFMQMPLDFEINNGQAPAAYAFVAHGPSYSLGISSSGLALSLAREDGKGNEPPKPGVGLSAVESSTVRLRLVGSTGRSQVTGLDPQRARSNYFIGNDPSKWKAAVEHFNRVKIAQTYPGVDLVFYGNRRQLEYDFDLAPGADPGNIRLEAEGIRSLQLDRDGNAILSTASGEVELKRPQAYQQIDGKRRPVESKFQIAAGNELKIALGKYDRGSRLVIDPVLVYGVELGGSNGSQALGLAVDGSGNAYVSGLTCSADFPSTSGNFQNLPTNSAQLHDCDSTFVVKMDPAGSTLIYSDIIGGTQFFSAAGHIAVDSAGDAFVTGATGAPDFPTVSNIGPTAPQPCAVETAGENCPVGFIFKLSPDGSKLLFSSLLGGGQFTCGLEVKLNPVTGDVVVLGDTGSSTFLPAPTTLETTFGGGSCYNGVPCYNGFLIGLDPVAGTLRYSTYIGGAGNDLSSGLAFDAQGNIYVSGSAQPPLSSSLGSVTHTYAPAGGTAAAGANLYVAKFNLSANHLSPGYLTLIQGEHDTAAASIAVDSTGNLYFGGASNAQHLPVTAGVYQSTNKATFTNPCLWPKIAQPYLPNPCGTGVVGKLDTTGSLSFLTYLGGTGQDMVQAIGTDSGGNIWLGGVTSSTDFPFSANHYTVSGPGFYMPFLAEMSNNGTLLPFATAIGGPNGMVSDLFVDGSNNVYVAGFVQSSSLTTPGTYPVNPQLFAPLFVQKWGPGSAPTISLSAPSMGFGMVALGSSSGTQTVTVTNTGTVAVELGVKLEAQYVGQTPADFPESTTCAASLAPGASCTITAAFAPGPPSQLCLNTVNCDPTQRTAAVLVENNATGGQQLIGLSGQTAIGASFYINPNPIVFPAQAAGTTSSPLYVTGGSTGDAQAVVSSMVFSGPNASDFQLQTTGVGLNCLNNPLQPGTYCSFSITFSPPATATGTRTATLTFTDNGADSPQTIPVTATVASANFLNISPLSLSPTFPAAIGSSATAVLDLRNPSTTASVVVTGLNIAGPNMGDFTVSTVSCGTAGALPGTIAPGATCYVDLTFTPAAGASGLRTATLTVQTTPGATGLPTVALSGEAVTNSEPAMGISMVPNPLNFGGLQVGETSNNASVLLTITNNAPIPCAGGASTCGAPLVVSSITPGFSDYTVSPQTAACALPTTIATGSNCTYAIVFKPSQAGSRNTTLTIQSNDPQGLLQVPLLGSGLSLPLAELLGSGLDFGNSAIGVASPPLTTTLENVGQANLVFSSVTASANFAVSSNTCTGTLAPLATCAVSVTFTPPSAGGVMGTLTISDNDPLGTQQIVTLAGTGATGPQLRIRPQSVDFGNQAAGGTSAPQTVTFASSGDSTVTFPASSLRVSSPFQLQSTSCGTSLPAQATCTVSVQYKPTVYAGGISDYGTLLITDNVTGNPQPVYLLGTSTQSTTAATTTTLASSLNPASAGQSVTFTATVAGPTGNSTLPTGSVNFLDGATIIGTGTLSAAKQATFSTSSLSVGSHSITAAYAGDSNFSGSTSTALTEVVNSISKANTTTTLASSANPSTFGQSVTFTATVTPPSGSSTAPTGTVSFLDGATSIGTGTVSAGAATLSTSSLTAGSHTITASYGGDSNFNGSTSAALAQVVNAPTKAATTTAVDSSPNPSSVGQSVTLTATVTSSGSSTAPTGTVSFLDGSTTIGTGNVSAGAATVSTVSLTAGSHIITASYGGDANFNGSTSTPLTQVVNAAAPSFSLSINPTTITVTAGGSGTTTVTVTPSSGFNQQVSFACSGLPTSSTCSFSPPTVTPNGSTSVTTTLMLATDVAAASPEMPAMPGRHRSSPAAATEFAVIVLIGIGGLVRTRRRLSRLFYALVFMAGLGIAISSCGGGGGGNNGGSTKTPTGSSTITVTATAGNLSQTANFTLTVQ